MSGVNRKGESRGAKKQRGRREGTLGLSSTAVKRPRRFSFYLVGFYQSNVMWKHGQGCLKQLVNVTIFSLFFKK